MEFQKKKILIVDDNQVFIMYVALLLKRMGFDVIPAENGIEALRLLKMMQPDLIMMDIYMPSMDGITLLEHIKSDNQICNIPSVMVSVETDKEVIERCQKLGCSGYLGKPIKIDKLHEILQKSIFSPIGIKRKYLRVEYRKKVTIASSNKSYELYTETISEGGLYIRIKEPFDVGSELAIRLPLKDNEYLDLKGVVIYIKGLFGDLFRIPPGMAIEFTNLDADKSRKLKYFIIGLLAGDILESQEEPVIED